MAVSGSEPGRRDTLRFAAQIKPKDSIYGRKTSCRRNERPSKFKVMGAAAEHPTNVAADMRPRPGGIGRAEVTAPQGITGCRGHRGELHGGHRSRPVSGPRLRLRPLEAVDAPYVAAARAREPHDGFTLQRRHRRGPRPTHRTRRSDRRRTRQRSPSLRPSCRIPPSRAHCRELRPCAITRTAADFPNIRKPTDG